MATASTVLSQCPHPPPACPQPLLRQPVRPPTAPVAEERVVLIRHRAATSYKTTSLAEPLSPHLASQHQACPTSLGYPTSPPCRTCLRCRTCPTSLTCPIYLICRICQTCPICQTWNSPASHPMSSFSPFPAVLARCGTIWKAWT